MILLRDAGKITIQLKLIHRKDIDRLPHLYNYLEVNNNESKSPSLFSKYLNECIKYAPSSIDLNYRLIIDCFNRKQNISHIIVSYVLFGKPKYFLAKAIFARTRIPSLVIILV